MHNTMISTTGMDHESHAAHDNSPYGTSAGWADVSSYSQSASVSEMGGFGYMSTGLPAESLSRIAPSPTTIQSQSQSQPSQPQSHPTSSPPSHQNSHHSSLPMLIMPTHTWPSMLTNPVPYSTAPLPVPAIAPPPPTKPLRTTTSSTPRRTLTDDDRRRMCRYHEDNPTQKQIDIGRIFGVERSTVSKVLRHKDKYLNLEDRSASPAKRTKGKLPDIERALAAWARKTQQSGKAVSDGEIWEKARHFAHGVNGTEHVQKLGTPWLEKFKQKHGIGQQKLSRRASETNLPSNARSSVNSPLLAHSHQQSSGISPASPTVEPSPLSGTRSDDDLKDSLSSLYSFRTDVFKRGTNQSTTSLSSAFTDAGTSSFSGSAVSPTGPFAFSPDSNVGSFLSDQRHIPGGSEANYQRPRSQTFPTLDIECLNQQAGQEPTTPRYPISSTAPSSALESPPHEMDARHFTLDSVVSSSSPQLHHSSSNGNLAAASKAAHLANNATLHSPCSPTLEDARRGLDLALAYVQRSTSRYDEHALMSVIQFFESAGLRHYSKAPGSSMHPTGGLSRIPEGGEDLGNTQGTSVKLETMMA